MKLDKFFEKPKIAVANNRSPLIVQNESKISQLEIPTGNPLVLYFENKKLVNAKYLDKDRAKDLLVF